MKKRYLILAGVLAVSLIAVGCGKKKIDDSSSKNAQVTVAPAEDEKGGDGDLVEMQKSTEEEIKNIMGTKTATASKVVLTNKTGADVKAVYIRPNIDDDEEWGEDLVKGAFTFRNGEKAVYYFEKDGTALYDIRIVYTDENRNECYFRKITLPTITQISLCMDGTGEASIPYATYQTVGSTSEKSTLNEVKQRLGLIDEDEGDYNTEEEEENQDENSSDKTSVTPTPEPGEADPGQKPGENGGENNGDNTDDDGEGGEETDSQAELAQSFIGQPLDSLVSACGEPIGKDYANEPETGETGYHYYDTFTVSTTVDEDGNEIVSGVW